MSQENKLKLLERNNHLRHSWSKRLFGICDLCCVLKLWRNLRPKKICQKQRCIYSNAVGSLLQTLKTVRELYILRLLTKLSLTLSLPCFSVPIKHDICKKTWTVFSNNVNTTIRKYSSRAFIWVVTPLGFVGQFRTWSFLSWFSQIRSW